MNPAGVVFGPHAQVDVPASFHVGTADEIRFADGNAFSATGPIRSTLSVAHPESFGYLSRQSGNLVVDGSTLTFQPGSTVTLSGGNLELDTADINVPGGELRITAMGTSVGAIPVFGALPVQGRGTLHIDHSALNTGGDGGGTIRIDAGGSRFSSSSTLYADNTGASDGAGGIRISATALEVNKTEVTADALAAGCAGSVHMDVSGLLNIVNGAYVGSSTYGVGDAGTVHVSAENLKIDGGVGGVLTGIASDAEVGSDGNAGRVTVTVSGKAALLDGGFIRSNTYGQGNAGTVNVSAGSLHIDVGVSDYTTGILSDARSGSNGNAGSVTVVVSGAAALLNGGIIASDTYSQGNAGTVHVSAGNLMVDAGGCGSFTGISSDANADSNGDAGSVMVAVSGEATLLNGGTISSSTFSQGNAGSVHVAAANLRVDMGISDYVTGISSDANPGSSGNAGSVTVAITGETVIANGGQIRSDTYSQGNAGMVHLYAGNLRIDRRGRGTFTGISSDANAGSNGDAGSVTVAVSGEASLLNGGEIRSNTYAQGKAGSVHVSAENLQIDGGASGFLTGIYSDAAAGSDGDAGSVTVAVSGGVSLLNGGQIRSETFSQGDAGTVNVSTGILRIERGSSDSLAGILSNAELDSSGDAGSVMVAVSGEAAILNGGEISSGTFSQGNAGQVHFSAGNLTIDGDGINDYFTGVSSLGNPGSSGNAGSVMVTVSGEAVLLNQGKISSSTFSQGNAGSVYVSAGNLKIDGGVSGFSTGILSDAELGSDGNAGRVTVAVSGEAELLNGGIIRSNTYGQGNAGTVNVSAGSLHIDVGASDYTTGILSDAKSGSNGNAGSVTVVVSGETELLNGGIIASDTYSQGNAGLVYVSAGNLLIDRGGSGFFTGISSDANAGSNGDAGSVTVAVLDEASLLNGGEISSGTFSQGNAGTVNVSAGSLRIDGGSSRLPTGISSQAGLDATGLAGDIVMSADHAQVLNGGEIGISNHGTISGDRLAHFIPGHLRVNVGTFELSGDSSLNASSVGNAPASSIDLNITQRLVVSGGSRITTEANSSDGGAITAVGLGMVVLRDGQISTSTRGGKGGNIVLSPGALIMEGGFIQANTAEGASGGTILVDTPYLITPHAIPPLVGGNERQVFQAGSGCNVIQAAAPGGEQGEITITSPDLNISGSLGSLGASLLAPVQLAFDPCRTFSGGKASSLMFGGNGVVYAGPEQPVIAYFSGGRLAGLLSPDGDDEKTCRGY
ncbi:MAG: hypothetical protein WC256_07020 [Desulfurivibrionaceae bacterium]